MSREPTAPPKPANGRDEQAPSAYSEVIATTPVSGFDEPPINILIVDDEPKNLTVLESVLNDSSYRLVRAATPDEALLALVVEEFALLILDIRMPGMTGFELATMIKQRKSTAVCTHHFFNRLLQRRPTRLGGYGTGAVDYLHKPLNPAVLRSKVSVFAELYRKNRDLGRANRALLAEIDHRRQVSEQLRELNETLEQRVTDRTAALRENESRLSHAANAARLTYVDVDFVRGVVRTAENFSVVMGYGSSVKLESDLSSCTRLLLRHAAPQDRPRVEMVLREFAGGKAVTKVDYRIRR